MAEEIIQGTVDYMKKRLANDSSGHDWWHSYRVWQLGKKIAISEKADLYVVELACLTHDIADYKLYGGDKEVGPRLAGELLNDLNVSSQTIFHVQEIIKSMNFGGPQAKSRMKTIEGKCVQDADLLDSLGAIGIARCFAFGGYHKNIIYNPLIQPNMKKSEEEYEKANATQINHFHEKILLIKDRLNTETARKIAELRHRFTEQFLEQFYKEWNLEI